MRLTSDDIFSARAIDNCGLCCLLLLLDILLQLKPFQLVRGVEAAARPNVKTLDIGGILHRIAPIIVRADERRRAAGDIRLPARVSLDGDATLAMKAALGEARHVVSGKDMPCQSSSNALVLTEVITSQKLSRGF